MSKYRLLLTTILLLATCFSSYAKLSESVSFKFKDVSTFYQRYFEVDFDFHKPRPKPRPKPPPTSKMMALFTEKMQQTWEKRYFLNLDLRTNLLYNVTLTPTVGFEWHINRNCGIKVEGSYTHWGSKHGMVQNIWLVNPEVRFYIKNTDLFYIGIGGNLGRINIFRGVIGSLFFPEDTGYQGSLFGGCITSGYKLILSRYFGCDFNLGLGYTYFKYDSFTVIDQRRVHQTVKLKDVTKNLLGPAQAGVSLVWKISGHRNWR